MKALSLWQPWASLIAVGAKLVETRSWQAPASVVGQRIAVHAAKRTTELPLSWEPPFAAFLHNARGDDGQLPLGCFVATAVVAECFLMDFDTCEAVREDMPEEHAFGDWRPGRYGWQLAEVQPLPEPVPYRGAQGLFEVWGALGQPERPQPAPAPLSAQGTLL